MKLTAYGKTDVGLLRSNNEDAFFLDEQLGLFIVADGMGGHAAGEIASKMAIDLLREKLKSEVKKESTAKELLPALSDAINYANRSIAQAAAENPAWSGMGTTLTVLLIHAQQALIGHVGDSRLYRWSNEKLVQLSDDHTLINEQICRGIISNQEAEQSNLRNILLQAVGIGEELDICQKKIPIEQGDRFLLCSDGLTNMLADEKISDILSNHSLPEMACEELIAQALSAGGKDNVTAVLITVKNEK